MKSTMPFPLRTPKKRPMSEDESIEPNGDASDLETPYEKNVDKPMRKKKSVKSNMAAAALALSDGDGKDY